MRVAGFFGGLNGENLCCAERDALAMRVVLASARGIVTDSEHAVLRRGSQLTRRAVNEFFAFAATADLDALVFYVSGHGNR